MFDTHALQDSAVHIAWCDLLWGYRHQLIGWRQPVELACVALVEPEQNDPILVELAGIGKDEDWRVGELLELLANRCSPSRVTSEKKWRYLELERIDHGWASLDDPFDDVFTVYMSHGFPPDMADLATRRYIPLAEYRSLPAAQAVHFRPGNLREALRAHLQALRAELVDGGQPID